MNFFLSIIIPIYNEQNHIKETLKKITDYFSRKDYYYELILVNDGSNDNTAEILRKYKEKLGLKVKEVPIHWLNSNDSKVRVIKDSFNMLLSLLKLKKIHKNF